MYFTITRSLSKSKPQPWDCKYDGPLVTVETILMLTDWTEGLDWASKHILSGSINKYWINPLIPPYTHTVK